MTILALRTLSISHMKNLALALLTLATIVVQAQVHFTPGSVSFSSQHYPAIRDLSNVQCKAMGDFDNDGDADAVVVATRWSTPTDFRLWFLENKGGLAFELKSDSLVLNTTNPPLVTDLDNDGDLDVLTFKHTSSTNAGYVNLALINQGNFNFTADTLNILDSIVAQRYTMINANNDGYPDLLVVGEKTGNIDGYTALFLNNGSGAFTTGGTSFGRVLGAGVQVIDRDLDGYDDILFVGYDQNSNKANYFFQNNQNGTFTSSLYSNGPMYGGRIFVDDFDNDGYPDFMVSTIYGTGTPNLFINNYPVAGFTVASSVLPGNQGFYEHFHLMLDLNNNGRQDILANLTAGSTPDTMKLYEKMSNGAYMISTTANLGDLREIGNYDTLDINGDGFTDIYDRASLDIFYNDTLGSFVNPDQFSIFSPNDFRQFEVVDFNGDGADDILMATTERNKSGLYLNRNGQYFERLNIPHFDGGYDKVIRTADVDGDGDMDFVGTNADPYVLYNNGNGQFTVQYLNTDDCDDVYLLNYDNQHYTDILLIQEDPNNSSQNEARIYVSDASGNYSQASVTGFPKINLASNFAVGDQNGDGLDDVYIGYAESGYSYGLFYNNGNGSFTDAKYFGTIYYRTANSDCYLAEMDGDSSLEVVAGSWTRISRAFGYYDYDTTGTTMHFDPDLKGGDYTSFSLTDLNGDARLDGVAYSTDNNELYYFINLQNGDFTSRVISSEVLTDPIVRAIDYDNDGDKDLFIAGVYGGWQGGWQGAFWENDSACDISLVYDSIYSCGAPITWRDSVQYTSDTSGVWLHTSDANQCDVMYNLHFEIVQPDLTVSTANSVTLEANAVGAQYQWLDCDNGYAPIVGETSKVFTPTANGNYAVEVSYHGCVDTSACTLIEEVGLTEFDENLLVLYPNPAEDYFELAYPAPDAQFTIYSVQGVVVLSGELNGNGKQKVNVESLIPGFYIVELQAGAINERTTLVVQ